MRQKQEAVKNTDIQKQKNEWRKKGWTIPDLRGGKQVWYDLVKRLVELVEIGEAYDLDMIPDTGNLVNGQTWRVYTPFLKGIGLVYNHAGKLVLSDKGQEFVEKPTKKKLADMIQERVRLFGEMLDVINVTPITVEEADQKICKKYGLNWKNLSNTRKRMDWLEVLGLIEAIGNRKWKVTESGKEALKKWCIINPEVLEHEDSDIDDIEIADPPIEIEGLLQKLRDHPEMHKKRCTYNIWAPSPNRIENLRIIIQVASNKISKKELFEFIEKEFELKLSSVESMLPFLKASGLLEEVGRNVYLATAAAQAWVETGNELDFIRILHIHMRFVGEILLYAQNDIVRNDIYHIGKNYGMNKEKTRWMTGFLLEAGLLDEPRYLHLKTTKMGKTFAETLPLEKTVQYDITEESAEEKVSISDSESNKLDIISERLRVAAVNPAAEGKLSGVAFEEAISDLFSYMGFRAEHIGGSGNTDVIVKWKQNDDMVVAILDGKSKSSGQVSHGDISDIALDTHKEKNNAEYVAVIGPGFSGETIKNFAIKKEYALITDKQLIEVANASQELGLSLEEIALMFQVPNGFSRLEEIISFKRREMDIITEIIRQFCNEQELLESLSPRDLFLLLRNSSVSPLLEELIGGFDILSGNSIGILKRVDKSGSPENVRYILHNENTVINKIRALANAIEQGMQL